MSSNVHLSFEHPQAYWPWSHSSGFHMADHGIHMPNYYYYQQQQQQHLRQQQQHQHQQAVDHGGGGGYSNPSTPTYHILHHRDTISEKEHLFEKPLTPSDVGKLNRLVIPKQHAEKHFPLDGDSGEKGLLLSFEDETGKAWRFRYSYWTSSQSYVLTKGWSRFVKEKRLDAGDVVLFQRRRSDADHLYIGCKRRGDPAGAPTTNGAGAGTPSSTTPWTAATQVLYGTPQQAAAVGPSYMCIDHNSGSSNVAHQHRGGDAAAPYQSQSTGTGPIASSTTTTTNSKRLRLFGVNLDLECSMESSESSSPSAETLQLELQGQFSHGSQRELQFLLPCIDGTSSYL